MKINFLTQNILGASSKCVVNKNYATNPFKKDEKDTFCRTTSFKGEAFKMDPELQRSFYSTSKKDQEKITIAFFASSLFELKKQDRLKHASPKDIVDETIEFQVFAQGEDSKECIDSFLKRNNIKTSKDCEELINFLRKVSNLYDTALFDSDAFVGMKSYLDNKEHIFGFPKTSVAYYDDLLTLYEEGVIDNDDIQFIDLNFTLSVLNKLGITKEADFQKKFSYLDKQNNNLQDSTDLLFAMFNTAYQFEYEIKPLLELIIAKNPQITCKSAEKLYAGNNEIIDYLCSQSPDKWFSLFENIILLNPKQEKPSSKTQQTIDNLMDTSTPLSKIKSLLFLSDQGFDIAGLNELTSRNDIQDTKNEDLIINKNTIVEYIAENKGIDNEDATDIYFKFAHCLNAIFECGDETYSNDGLAEFIKIIDEFKLKNDKEFVKFYNELNQASQQKNKKIKIKPQKPKQTDIRNFVELLSFRDDALVEKYQKNEKSNRQMFVSTLKKRKNEYETNKPLIEKALNNSDLIEYSTQSAFDVYKKYIEFLKTKNIALTSFLNGINFSSLKDNDEYQNILSKFDSFQSFFSNNEQIRSFISHNGIKLDSSKESETYYNHCIEIIKILNKYIGEKQKKFLQKKILENDFIKNSKASLGSILKDGSEKEIKTLFETVLTKDINSIKELNSTVNVCKIKDKKSVIEHFLSQTNIDKYEYPKRIRYIEDALKNLGPSIIIDADNIGCINLEEFPTDKKINQTRLIQLANDLAKSKGNGNFIANLECAKQADGSMKAFPRKIVTEITNTLGKNTIPYYNIMREFHLPCIEDLDAESQKMYGNIITSMLPEEFTKLLDDNEYEIFDNGEKFCPNITIHAKMRAIERFILNTPGSINKLSTSQAKDELTKLFKTIYTTTPSSVVKSKDGRFVATFNNEDGSIIKAVFVNNGTLITVSRC